MLRVTPRATVVHALARREAELLDQAAASGHVLVALIWEGGGMAAAALAEVGLPKGSDHEIRQRLTDAPDSERGVLAADLHGQAAVIAAGLGHDYIGTEHQLLAIAKDETLADAVLPWEARERAAAWLGDRLKSTPDS
jgi:hypothetical protein